MTIAPVRTGYCTKHGRAQCSQRHGEKCHSLKVNTLFGVGILRIGNIILLAPGPERSCQKDTGKKDKGLADQEQAVKNVIMSKIGKP